ncbi:MAG: toxin-activating lysine-acyltransferase [Novosphingobium sp.]
MAKGMDMGTNGAGEAAAIMDAAANAPSVTPQLDPEVLAKIASLRSHVRESFGKVVMAMMMLPRYRHQTLADLQHLVLEPLIRDRIAIAQRAGDNAVAEDIAGVAVWASVSEEADIRIREQIRGNTWPLRLAAEDWNSGSINWLIDVIAPDQRSTASVIANFRQVVKEGELKLHPLITRLLDEETLKKMGAHKAGDAAAPEAAAAERMPEPVGNA